MLHSRLIVAVAASFVASLTICFVGGSAHAECRPGAFATWADHAQIRLPATPPTPSIQTAPSTDPSPVPSFPTPMPLVILLHGSTGSGAEILRNSHLADTADRHGFVIAAPNGGIPASRGYVWNIPGVPTVDGTLPAKDARDDVAYLTGLVDRLVATGCVDGSRVYVTGLSGGGRMASWLGCVAPRRFAAIAPVVGLRAGRPLAADPQQPDPATCRPRTPLPLLAFSGDADTTNPIEGGGAPYWQYPQSAALQRWAMLNGCVEPYARTIGATVYEQGYARCRGDATVAVRVRRGGPHAWSVVDNEALWAFLSRHRR